MAFCIGPVHALQRHFSFTGVKQELESRFEPAFGKAQFLDQTLTIFILFCNCYKLKLY